MIDKSIKKSDQNQLVPDFMCEFSFFEDVFRSNPLESCTVIIKKCYFGNEDNELTRNLLKSFFLIMADREVKPCTFIFMSDGINLVCEESKIINSLEKISEEGVSIMVCGESINYYNKKEKMKIGFISNMCDICEILLKSVKIINL
jgi:intracellular sulfur oxidation DsrE/DsrF family protein